MRRLPMVANVVSSAALNRPELRIYPRRDLAVRLGRIDRELVRDDPRCNHRRCRPGACRSSTPGIGSVPIRVLLEENARADRQVLEQIRVPSLRGGGVPLIALADIELRRRPDQHHSIRPPAAGQRGGGSRRRRRAQRGTGGHQRAAGDEEPSRRASRSAEAATPSCKPSCSRNSAAPCGTAC